MKRLMAGFCGVAGALLGSDRLLAVAARRGSLRSLHALGMRALAGQEQGEDDSARQSIQMAANLGYAPAQYQMGRLSTLAAAAHEGREAEDKEHRAAFWWYQQAAAEGNADSALALGYVCLRGWGTEQDWGEAVTWFKVARSLARIRRWVSLAARRRYRLAKANLEAIQAERKEKRGDGGERPPDDAERRPASKALPLRMRVRDGDQAFRVAEDAEAYRLLRDQGYRPSPDGDDGRKAGAAAVDEQDRALGYQQTALVYPAPID